MPEVRCPKCPWSGRKAECLSHRQYRGSSGILVCPACRKAPVLRVDPPQPAGPAPVGDSGLCAELDLAGASA